MLDGVEPGKPALDFSIGAPQHAPPSFVREVLAESFLEYRGYPPNDDPDYWREAVGGWISRRYGVPTARFEPSAQDMALQPL
ncbi:MAG: aspartate aminotransferase, partial [Pseudomonadota bacterium]